MTEVIAENKIIEDVQENTIDDNKWCVYMHTNLINNKVYIGITSRDPEKRWGKNGNEYTTKNHPAFGYAIEKYGWNNFSHDILFDGLSKQDACQKEIELIKEYKSNCTRYKNPSFGYNMSDGGEIGSSGYIWSDEAKKKLSNALRGVVKDEEWCLHLSQAMSGKTATKETRNKLRESHLGKVIPAETREKMGKSRTGYKNPRAHPVYCIEMDQIFWGAKDVENQYLINRSCIHDCCTGKQKTSGKHPITGEKLHWLYTEDAINYGYITQEDFDNYLDSLKQKGID